MKIDDASMQDDDGWIQEGKVVNTARSMGRSEYQTDRGCYGAYRAAVLVPAGSSQFHLRLDPFQSCIIGRGLAGPSVLWNAGNSYRWTMQMLPVQFRGWSSLDLLQWKNPGLATEPNLRQQEQVPTSHSDGIWSPLEGTSSSYLLFFSSSSQDMQLGQWPQTSIIHGCWPDLIG